MPNLKERIAELKQMEVINKGFRPDKTYLFKNLHGKYESADDLLPEMFEIIQKMQEIIEMQLNSLNIIDIELLI